MIFTLLSRLALSFCISAVVALCYSFIIHEFCVLYFVYPELWLGEVDIIRRASRELKKIPRLVTLLSMLTIIVPLLWTLNFVLDSARSPRSRTPWSW